MEFSFPSILLELAPPEAPGALPARCQAADDLRGEWYRALPELQPLALAALWEHMAGCLCCLRIGEYNRRVSMMAVHPRLSAEEMGEMQ